jgi:hypothetical protein
MEERKKQEVAEIRRAERNGYDGSKTRMDVAARVLPSGPECTRRAPRLRVKRLAQSGMISHHH